MWWMIALTGASTLVLLYLLNRRDEARLKREWTFLLSRRAERLYARVEERVTAELAVAETAYDEAFAVHELGSVDDAIQLLAIGYRVIEIFAPNMMRLLSTMSAFSRMIAAVTPIQPLRPRDFRLPEIVNLAHLNRLVHAFLVSAGERFRLRAYILGQSFGVALRYLLRSTRRIVGREQASEREWEQIQLVREDLDALTRESLESMRALLAALDAERAEQLLKEL
jgi:hypothetical protein